MGSTAISRSSAVLLAVTAAAAVAIASGDTGFLAVASPLLVALVPLLAGLFPGERAIERAASWLDGFRPRATGSPADFFLPPDVLRPLGLIATGTNGARAPPLNA